MNNKNYTAYEKPKLTETFFEFEENITTSGYGLMTEGFGDEVSW